MDVYFLDKSFPFVLKITPPPHTTTLMIIKVSKGKYFFFAEFKGGMF